MVCALKYLFAATIFSPCSHRLSADSGDSIGKQKKVVLGFYGDFYTGVAGRNPGLKAIPYFVTAAGLRQANANLVYASFELNHRGIRIYLAPAAGSYMKANYAAEPSWIRNVLEARAGFCLNRKRSIWLDAGLMSAPFTMEQAVNRDLLTYSRSLGRCSSHNWRLLQPDNPDSVTWCNLG